ncbi:hypothetical protein SH661x_001489 [Planctomicrobium sp. SH661]|uniref:hypothetical protein n=1 Tax=Planctomicrobium sp. SH661 TaxID=3448124 RepID=UPI003F5B455A
MLNRALSCALLAFALGCLPAIGFAEEETKEFKAQDLTLQVPKNWTEKAATNNLRLAQFDVPAAEGDTETAELVVFPPFGGTVAENVKRWVAQFQPEGLKATFTQGKVPQGTYVLADLSGTYNKPDGPPFMRKTKPAPGYRVIAVMLTTEKEGSYFLKLTGPEKTVAAALDAFRKSFGADASKEEKYEF